MPIENNYNPATRRTTPEARGPGRALSRSGRLPLALLTSLFAVCALADSTPRSFRFDISSASLSQALRNFCRVSGEEIIFTDDLVEGKTAPPLRGEYTAQAALERLLKGTGLTAERSPSGALMIRRPQPVTKALNATRPSSLASGADAGPGADRAHWSLVLARAEGRDSASSPSLSAQASEASSPAGPAATALDEVVVTAQKRSERLNDVPISVTAVTGEQLVRQGVWQPSDLTRIVPGFTYQQTNWSTPVYSIRGIGLYSTYAGIAPAVSVYVDQVPLPYLVMTSGAALDLERLEVLKGPQGTLFGQNSTGGAINYIAAKPTRVLSGGVDASYGRFNDADVTAFLSGPVSDTLSARVAFRHDGRDDWQRSETRPDDRLGRRDFSQGRLLVDWTPFGALKLELNVNGYVDRSDTQAAQFVHFCAAGGLAEGTPCVGGFPDTIALASRAPSPKNALLADWDPGVSFAKNEHLSQFALTGTLDLPNHLSLTSLTSYADFDTLTPNDADGTQLDTFRLTVDAKIHTFSQELRLSGNLTEKANVTLGANYEHDVVKNDDIGLFNSSNSGISPTLRYHSFIDRADQVVSTAAAFGSLDFKITDTLTAQAGIRYTHQDRNFSGCLLDTGDNELSTAFTVLRSLFTGQVIPIPPGACVTFLNSTNFMSGLVTSSLDQSNVSWRAGLDWKPADTTLIYGNVTKGYKSGAYEALPAVSADQFRPVTQESVLAYELGVKSDVTRSVEMTAAAFYYDYRDKQLEAFLVLPVFGTVPALRNIPKSRVAGGEVNLRARPFEGLALSVGATYIDSKVTQSFVGPDPIGIGFDYQDHPFPSTPKVQLVGDGQYTFPLEGWASGYVGASVVHHSSSYAAFVIDNDPDFLLNAYWLLDLRLGVESPDEKVRVQAWARNVTNEFYLVQAARYPDSISRTVGMPRTYGISLSYRF